VAAEKDANTAAAMPMLAVCLPYLWRLPARLFPARPAAGFATFASTSQFGLSLDEYEVLSCCPTVAVLCVWTCGSAACLQALLPQPPLLSLVPRKARSE
jgi:hypothetical protein